MCLDLVKIEDIKFGKVDANSEYLDYGKDVYKSLFLPCPSFHVHKFLGGQSYYIHGEKGSGKTALLKYIEAQAEENGSLVEYVRFKKDIDEDDRNRIKRAGIPNHPFEEIIEKDIPSDSSINCVLAWEVYIIKCIVNRIRRDENIDEIIIKETKSWKNLSLLIDSAYQKEYVNFKRILPSIKKGRIQLEFLKGQLECELEWDNKDEKLIMFSSFAKKIISLFDDLEYVGKACYILVDELELVYAKEKSYERDIALIRDLMQAIYYVNEISKKHEYNIHVIACIRNEVIRGVQAVGNELTKLIEDYGVEMSWSQSGGHISEHPLIKMLMNRLVQSQKNQDIKTIDSMQIWRGYFGKDTQIMNQSVMNYIIAQTWNRPRDITRLFTLIQKKAENKTRIEKADFEAVRAKYSELSWVELTDELSAKYTRDEVCAIQQVLTGIEIPFTINYFNDRLRRIGNELHGVDQLQKKYTATEILGDLYRIGVVGTSGDHASFNFAGCYTFDVTKECTIHYPLRKHLSTVNTKKRRVVPGK